MDVDYASQEYIFPEIFSKIACELFQYLCFCPRRIVEARSIDQGNLVAIMNEFEVLDISSA